MSPEAMEALKVIGFLFVLPWIFIAATIFSVVLAAIIMAPVDLFFTMIFYKFNWREAFDMEFGTKFRKFEDKPTPRPVLRRIK